MPSIEPGKRCERTCRNGQKKKAAIGQRPKVKGGKVAPRRSDESIIHRKQWKCLYQCSNTVGKQGERLVASGIWLIPLFTPQAQNNNRNCLSGFDFRIQPERCQVRGGTSGCTRCVRFFISACGERKRAAGSPAAQFRGNAQCGQRSESTPLHTLNLLCIAQNSSLAFNGWAGTAIKKWNSSICGCRKSRPTVTVMQSAHHLSG
jgi:hypothetical protein